MLWNLEFNEKLNVKKKMNIPILQNSVGRKNTKKEYSQKAVFSFICSD